MEVRRLAWAGLEISAGGQRLVIDLVEDFSWLHGDLTSDGQVPPPPQSGSVHVALLTHLHRDHADPTAIARALQSGASVLRPERASGRESKTALVRQTESEFEESDLATRVVEAWETVETGPFEITALPAVDGFGDPQVSWSDAADGCRVLHAGDTLFHGWWWLIAERHGPFDVAFLPAGGAVVDLPTRQPPSPLPAGMDPDQAAVTAELLRARQVVPIHYGPLHEAPNYVQVDDPPGRLCAAARDAGVEARVLAPGERSRIQSTQR